MTSVIEELFPPTADMLLVTGKVRRKPGQRNTIHAEGDPKPFQEDLVVYRVERCCKVEQDESSSVATVDRIKKI